MSNKKKLFSTLATVTAGAIAGTAIALTPVVAVADDHDKEHEENKCSGDKKDDHDDGEHACGGEGKCSGDKGE